MIRSLKRASSFVGRGEHGAADVGTNSLLHQIDERVGGNVEVSFGHVDDFDEGVIVKMILRHQNDVGVLEDLLRFFLILRSQPTDQKQKERQAQDWAFEHGDISKVCCDVLQQKN